MQNKVKIENIEIDEPRKVVLAAMRYVATGSALDLGAGFGRHSLLLAEKGFTVTAVESDIKKLKSLEEKASKLGVLIHTEASDLRDFNSHGEKYDLILSTMVLHFLSNREEVELEIQKMQEMTKQNGINVITAYTDKSQSDLRPYLVNTKDLKKLYDKWTLLQYEELQGTDAKIDGSDKGKLIWRVEMIAQKLKSREDDL